LPWNDEAYYIGIVNKAYDSVYNEVFMDEIKSAWEIALENTKDISMNKDSAQERENVVQGKKIVSRFLDDPARTPLADELKALSGKTKEQVKKGMLETLLANLTLPQSGLAETRNKRVTEGILNLAPTAKPLQQILNQLSVFFKNFADERDRVEEALEAQYAPRLQQKADAIAKQLGAEVELKARQDPEFVALLKKNLAAFDERYGGALVEVKAEIGRLVLKSA
jgi:hypothetical protein